MLYMLFLLVFSFLGVNINFLFNSINMIDLCMRSPALAKVIESITSSAVQVGMTIMLGLAMQYILVGFSFLSFSTGYGFADMDTSGCATLLECLYGHWDYGFRSAPVWHSANLTATRFIYDYSYNLLIILIMAAIISGIIIDTFAGLKEAQGAVTEAMQSSCFICSLGKSELGRQGVNFEEHIYKDHYMWAYARFLLHLKETERTNLTGPESYVQHMIKGNNMGFFPLYKCIKTEASDSGEAHLEREVQVKDLDDFKVLSRKVADRTDSIMKAETNFKTELRDLRENMMNSSVKIQALQQMLVQEDDQDKKKKKKKKKGA